MWEDNQIKEPASNAYENAENSVKRKQFFKIIFKTIQNGSIIQ